MFGISEYMDDGHELSNFFSFSLKRIANLSFDFFLFYQVMEGLIKYMFVKANLVILMHGFKFLLVAAIFVQVWFALSHARADLKKFVFAILLFISVAVGFYFIPYKNEVVYGLYLWLPFCFGFFFGDLIEFNSRRIQLCKALLMLACIGIVLDFFLDVPWQGFEYESFGQERQASRDWKQFSLERPAGFSGLSWSAASHVAILGLIVVHHLKSRLWRFSYSFLCLASIALSTTKGAIMAFFVTLIVTLFPKAFRTPIYLLVLFPSVMLGLIPYFFEINYPSGNSIWSLVFYSFFVRLVETWPQYYEILVNSGSIFFGKGMGGFGGATFMNFDTNSHSSDSFFLYVWGLFGISGVLFFYYNIIKSFVFPVSEMQRILLMAFVINGMVVNGIEFGVWGLFLGVVLGMKKI